MRSLDSDSCTSQHSYFQTQLRSFMLYKHSYIQHSFLFVCLLCFVFLLWFFFWGGGIKLTSYFYNGSFLVFLCAAKTSPLWSLITLSLNHPPPSPFPPPPSKDHNNLDFCGSVVVGEAEHEGNASKRLCCATDNTALP